MGVLDGEVAIMTGAECRRGTQRATTVVLAASEADVKVAGLIVYLCSPSQSILLADPSTSMVAW